MSVVVLGRNLMVTAAIVAAAARHGQQVEVIADPATLTEGRRVRAVVVDWDDRQPGWGAAIRAWLDDAIVPAQSLMLFGPHVDRLAHAEARHYGVGPVLPRSRLLEKIEALLSSTASAR